MYYGALTVELRHFLTFLQEDEDDDSSSEDDDDRGGGEEDNNDGGDEDSEDGEVRNNQSYIDTWYCLRMHLRS